MIILGAIFCALSLLMCVEATSAIARAEGYRLGRVDASMVTVNAVNLASRVLMAFILPAIGFFADLGRFEAPGLLIAGLQALIPFGLILVYLFRENLAGILSRRIFILTETGSLFARGDSSPIESGNRFTVRMRRRVRRRLPGYLIGFGVAMLPHYCIWGMLLFFIQIYPDYRATLVASTSVFNGVTVLALSLYFDPLLVRLANTRLLAITVLEQTLMARLWSAILSVIVLLGCVLFTQ
jgi:hypothetical protein